MEKCYSLDANSHSASQKKSLAIYGTRRITTVFTRVHQFGGPIYQMYYIKYIVIIYRFNTA